jgi:proteic killer suppression protein
MAILSFRDATARDIYNGANSRAARKIATQLWPRVAMKLDQLNAAASLNDLKSPGNQLEKLEDNLAGYWSIRVNVQYRICFQFEKGNASNVFCDDIH